MLKSLCPTITFHLRKDFYHLYSVFRGLLVPQSISSVFRRFRNPTVLFPRVPQITNSVFRGFRRPVPFSAGSAVQQFRFRGFRSPQLLKFSSISAIINEFYFVSATRGESSSVSATGVEFLTNRRILPFKTSHTVVFQSTLQN